MARTPLPLLLVLAPLLVLLPLARCDHGIYTGPDALHLNQSLQHPGAAGTTNGTALPPRGPLIANAALITVGCLAAAVTILVGGLVMFQCRGRHRLEVERQEQREQRQQERAEEEARKAKEASVLHEVFIPPVIFHPDASFHLGTLHSGEQDGTEADGGGGRERSVHGRTVLVKACESAFSRVTLYWSPASRPDAGTTEVELPAASPEEAARDGQEQRRQQEMEWLEAERALMHSESGIDGTAGVPNSSQRGGATSPRQACQLSKGELDV